MRAAGGQDASQAKVRRRVWRARARGAPAAHRLPAAHQLPAHQLPRAHSTAAVALRLGGLCGRPLFVSSHDDNSAWPTHSPENRFLKFDVSQGTRLPAAPVAPEEGLRDVNDPLIASVPRT